MSKFMSVVKRATPYLFPFLLPFLIAVYPAIFHDANNARIVMLSSLGKMVIFLSGIAAILYFLFCLARRFKTWQVANATSVFMLFFHTYGLLFSTLRVWDKIPAEHYILLPVFLMLGLYTAWFTSQVNEKLSKRLWTSAVIILSALVIFNVARIVPQEIRKVVSRGQTPDSLAVEPHQPTDKNYPDIYYIVFDEMAGLDAVRKYWKYEDVNKFVDFLQSRGFYVAENSHAMVPYTFYELASRLNFEIRPYDPSNPGKYQIQDFAAIAENKVMQFLKSNGYTTIAYDQHRSAYEGAPPLQVDFLYEQAADEVMRGTGRLDDFGAFVLENTMLQPLVNRYKLNSPALEQHRNMILFTVQNVASEGISAPKVVYVHLLVPHIPFMFDANGNLIQPQYHHDWDKYLGNYIFTLHIAEEMINNILDSADPKNPPIIIIQSDHGARNLQISSSDIMLENYPEEYKTLIVNALYLPGCDDAPLTQDMNPINTFPIVFNCYFDAGIPLK